MLPRSPILSALGVVLTTSLLLIACEPTSEIAETGPLDLRVALEPYEGGYQIASQEHIVPPNSEVSTCDVVRIEPHDAERLVWVNKLQSRTSSGSHHMNVNIGRFSGGDFISEGTSELLLGKPLGHYDCEELGDLMEEQGVTTLYPSQRQEQGGQLPKGVALPLVLPLVVIMEHHYINLEDRPVLVNAVLNLGSIPEAEVEHVVAGVSGGIQDIGVPARSRKVEAKTCKLSRDFKLFAISSHSHEKGNCFSMNLYDEVDNTVEKEPFFINKDWESPPILFFEQAEWTGFEPLSMKKGQGIHWACHYVNDEDRKVVRGPSATDEMCIFVAMGYPSAVSVEAIKEAVANPSLDLLDKISDDTISCDPVTEATSPWLDANVAVSLDDNSVIEPKGIAPETSAADADQCAAYNQTEVGD